MKKIFKSEKKVHENARNELFGNEGVSCPRTSFGEFFFSHFLTTNNDFCAEEKILRRLFVFKRVLAQ